MQVFCVEGCSVKKAYTPIFKASLAKVFSQTIAEKGIGVTLSKYDAEFEKAATLSDRFGVYSDVICALLTNAFKAMNVGDNRNAGQFTNAVREVLAGKKASQEFGAERFTKAIKDAATSVERVLFGVKRTPMIA